MVLLKTPGLDVGWKAEKFELIGVSGNNYYLDDLKGENGTVIVFMCNHCPYVQAVIDRMVSEANTLKNIGVSFIGINSNDADEYEEDSYSNMKVFADKHKISFPYLVDPTQSVAKSYGAVCTPDFFGFNKNLELLYRGRLDSAGMGQSEQDLQRELFLAMSEIAETGQCVKSSQKPSMGCSIKWKD